ncbi:helix-turn-helix domain-containing protein [Streptomyces sp. NPDC001339]|uniref:helix-turn-helix domain-containing protein n=1 Tax=Streptomyces sp. NPDC001339 TaxID=3364563 RepID=UPI0036AC2EE1
MATIPNIGRCRNRVGVTFLSVFGGNMGYRGIPTARKRLLGSQLRRLREQRKLSVEAVGEQLGVGPSSVRRQESGHTAISVADAKAYLDIYELEDQELRRKLLELARYSRVRGWWAAYGKTVGPTAVDVADMEDLATEIRTFQPLLVPGIMQTQAYSEAMANLGAGIEDRGWDLEKVVAVRERRKAILDREKPLHVWAIIGEAALLTAVGGPEVMAEQIGHLLLLGQRSNISLQLLPFAAGAHLGMSGAFVLLDFADADTTDGSIMYVEGGGAFSDDPGRVRSAISRFSNLQAQALSTGDTQRYFAQTAKEWRDRT